MYNNTILLKILLTMIKRMLWFKFYSSGHHVSNSVVYCDRKLHLTRKWFIYSQTRSAQPTIHSDGPYLVCKSSVAVSFLSNHKLNLSKRRKENGDVNRNYKLNYYWVINWNWSALVRLFLFIYWIRLSNTNSVSTLEIKSKHW